PLGLGSVPELSGFALFWPEIFVDRDYPCFARSQLDLTPPPQLADRLANYFLPNCASFKVEWALDPNSDFVGGLLEPSDAAGDNWRESGVFWFDPGAADPLVSVEDVIADPKVNSERGQRLEELIRYSRAGASYSIRERFTTVGPVEWRDHGFGDDDRANLAVFAASRRDTNDVVVPEEIFPAALRITVDMFDREGRLERPIRHVMVIPVGE
ncbi:MAG: hypothetical protein KJ749_09470, partial [Planctomycetes bacterium]|nr:hypothetical protein [Planctomycetota bacterium]